MLTREENKVLTQVVGGAPMGRLMRRSWVPALMSSEVSEADGVPVRLEVLGEKLVAFRDTRGRIGVLDERCPHRGASLALGRNEDCGLRCLYHGWKFDVDGNGVEFPSEPRTSQRAGAIRAYPVQEGGGFVWIYLGKGQPPAFHLPPWADLPGTDVVIAKFRIPVNWAQVLEGAVDSAHTPTLHSHSVRLASDDNDGAAPQPGVRPTRDNAPRIFVQPTQYGFRYAAVRTPLEDSDTNDYTRVTVYIAPFIAIVPPNERYTPAQVTVPVNDHETYFYFISFGAGPGMFTQDEWIDRCGARVGVDLHKDYRSKLRTIDNDFLQDREAMAKGDFTGIFGVPYQDIAMWETMGSISDRTHENLGASDIAIVQFRNRMINAARAETDPRLADQRLNFGEPIESIRTFAGIVPKSVDWRTLATTEHERSLFIERKPLRRVLATAAE